MTIRVVLVDPRDRALLDAAFALRHQVFVEGQGVDPALERDELDAIALHVVSIVDEDVVGTGRMLSGDAGSARIGRMAVRADVRGSGVGAAMLRRLERAAIARGYSEIVLHAQAHAAGFYARAGYRPVGERFVEAGIEHIEMRKELPRVRPVADTDSESLIALIGGIWAEYPGCVLDVDAEEPWMRAPATAFVASGGRCWVATVDSAVVAVVGVRPASEPGTWELKSLYVAAAARRSGLGAALTDLAEAQAIERGGARMLLWSDTRFIDAHRLYTRLGYRATGRTRDLHDLSNTTEYEFVKELG